MEQAYFALRLLRLLLFLAAVFHGAAGVLIFFMSPVLSEKLLKTPLLSFPLRFAGIGLFFMAFVYVIAGFLQGMGLVKYVKQGFLVLWIPCILVGSALAAVFSPYGEKVAVFMRNPVYRDLYTVFGIGVGLLAGCFLSFLYFLVVLILVIRRNDAYFDDLPRQDIPTGNFFITIPSYVLTLFFRFGVFFLDILIFAATQEKFTFADLGSALFGGFLLTLFLSMLFSLLPMNSLRGLQLALKNREIRDAGDILEQMIRNLYLFLAPVSLYLFAAAPALQELLFGEAGELQVRAMRILSFALLVFPLLPFFDSFLQQGRKGRLIWIAGGAAFLLHLILFTILMSRGMDFSTAFSSALLCYALVRSFVEIILVFRMVRLKADLLRAIGIPMLISAVLSLVVFLFVGNVKLPALMLTLLSLLIMGGLYTLAVILIRRNF